MESERSAMLDGQQACGASQGRLKEKKPELQIARVGDRENKDISPTRRSKEEREQSSKGLQKVFLSHQQLNTHFVGSYQVRTAWFTCTDKEEARHAEGMTKHVRERGDCCREQCSGGTRMGSQEGISSAGDLLF